MKKIICTFLCCFLLLGTSCSSDSKRDLDVPYICGASETDKQKWTEDKITYLEEKYGKKVISVEEDEEFITFILETEYMSPNVQIEEESYSKLCDTK